MITLYLMGAPVSVFEASELKVKYPTAYGKLLKLQKEIDHSPDSLENLVFISSDFSDAPDGIIYGCNPGEGQSLPISDKIMAWIKYNDRMSWIPLEEVGDDSMSVSAPNVLRQIFQAYIILRGRPIWFEGSNDTLKLIVSLNV